MNKKQTELSYSPSLRSKDIRESRERVDRAVEIVKEDISFTKADFEKALKKVSQRSGKAKSSLKLSET